MIIYLTGFLIAFVIFARAIHLEIVNNTAENRFGGALLSFFLALLWPITLTSTLLYKLGTIGVRRK